MLLPSNRMQCFQIILQYFGSIRACNQEFTATQFFSLICHFYITNIFTGVGTAFQNREKYLRIEEMGCGLRNGLRI